MSKLLNKRLLNIAIFGFFLLVMSTSDAHAFRFVSWADTKSARGDLRDLSNNIRDLPVQPVFTIFPGDLESDGPTCVGLREWKKAINGDLSGDTSNGLFDITFATRGNHDDRDDTGNVYNPNSCDDTVHDEWWHHYFDFRSTANSIPGISNYTETYIITVDNKEIPFTQRNMTYSFDYENSHFVGIEITGTVTEVTTDQTKWLDKDLTAAAQRGLTHAFLFFHGPPYHIERNLKDVPQHLVNIFNDHPIISATFNGHEHAYAWVHLDKSRISSLNENTHIEQFITGSAGAGPTYCLSGRCDFDLRNNGYSTIDVNGPYYTVSYYEIYNTTPAWTQTFSNSTTPLPTPTGPTSTPFPTGVPTNTPFPTAIPTPDPTQTTHQAEDAVLSSAEPQTQHSGYDGTGYVNFLSDSGAKITFNNVYSDGGTLPITFRYAQFDSDPARNGQRTVDVRVNGINYSVSFPNTLAWNDWGEKTINVNLVSGSNAIEVITTGQDGPNVDYLSLSSSTPQPTPTPDPNCTPVGTGDTTSPQDYSAWAFNYHPQGNPLSGGRSVGDFDCSGAVGPQDFSIWQFYYDPLGGGPVPTAVPTISGEPTNTPRPTMVPLPTPTYPPTEGNVYYIEKGGTDPSSGCNGGTRSNPWNSYDPECLDPGDTVFVVPNDIPTVFTNDELFGGSKISYPRGIESAPIKIAALGNYKGYRPVKINGNIKMEDKWIILEGFEIDGGGSSSETVIVGQGVEGIVLKNMYIHSSSGGADCIKLVNDAFNHLDRTEKIQVIDSEVASCGEDCFDVTGSRDIVLRGNDFYGCRDVQVKGGSENVLIEKNIIHPTAQGIRGSRMDCGSRYCGSPLLPELEVRDRYVAKNVTIRNNLIYGPSIDGIWAKGWRGAKIYHNTIYSTDTPLTVGSSGLKFFDDKAKAYCRDNPNADPTITCGATTSDYAVIDFGAKDVWFKNNIVSVFSGSAVKKSSNSLTGYQESHNMYHDPGSVNPQLVNPPSDMSLRSSSPAINAGTLLDVYDDFNGNLRDTLPDLGAYEY